MIIKNEAKNQNGKVLSKSIKENYSKLECMKNKVYEEKSYLTEMSMWNARLNFSLRTQMFPCKMNNMNSPKFKADLWLCDSFETLINSQSHILYCPAYKQMREGKSLTSDSDIVEYFKKVLEIRTKLNLNK